MDKLPEKAKVRGATGHVSVPQHIIQTAVADECTMRKPSPFYIMQHPHVFPRGQRLCEHNNAKLICPLSFQFSSVQFSSVQFSSVQFSNRWHPLRRCRRRSRR